MILTSDRKFGVEIEFACPTNRQLMNVAARLPVVRDGSIVHIPNSGEYVSPVLQGESGEREINHACEILKKHGASGEEICMSVHVHHDARKYAGSVVTSKTQPTMEQSGNSVVYAVSNKVLRGVSKNEIEAMVRDGLRPYKTKTKEDIVHNIFNNIHYLTLAPVSAPPEKFITYVWYQYEDRTKWLRNVLYFYTLYSNVMESIVSNSRRTGNMYCIPLGLSFNLDNIIACTSVQELKNVWYKGGSPNGHYDDSRYHNVNLHSYWDRHGTVEIRSHGGTVDPKKILLWVRLHQKILDKLENMDTEQLVLPQGADLFRSFIEFVEEPVLQAYIKRLLGFYSGIIIK